MATVCWSFGGKTRPAAKNIQKLRKQLRKPMKERTLNVSDCMRFLLHIVACRSFSDCMRLLSWLLRHVVSKLFHAVPFFYLGKTKADDEHVWTMSESKWAIFRDLTISYCPSLSWTHNKKQQSQTTSNNDLLWFAIVQCLRRLCEVTHARSHSPALP